jgi:hypothetical protein
MENRTTGNRDESGGGTGASRLPRRCAIPSILAAGLLALALAGCKPASNDSKTGAGTNVTAKPLTNAVSAAPRAMPRTNLPAVARLLSKTNAAPGAPAPGAKPGAAASGAVTNASLAARGTNAIARAREVLQRLQGNRAFYPAAAVVVFGLIAALIYGISKAKARRAAAAASVPVVSTAPAGVARKARQAPIHSCNVLSVGAGARQLWQFDARGGRFSLNREQSTPVGEALPAALVAKDWSSLWQRKLNIAWLPAEAVFLRVAQFPRSDFAETLSMVELQLEKLSPMPVAQVVWSIQVLPHAKGELQTVVVVIAARSAVEEFLGQLEGQGYLADRLDLPLLDQLQAAAPTEDAAVIYPGAAGGQNTALVGWWCQGVLQNLDLLNLPPANRPASLKEQLVQMAWAGEMEGWLTCAPRWRLVADEAAAAEWLAPLREGLEQPIEVTAPLPAPQAAALNARRAAQAEMQANLLPAEFSARYQQQFVDRLWMRGLAGVVVIYLIGLAIYGVAVGFATLRTGSVEGQAAELAPTYTNALELKARCQVLQDRSELKFAALDCYQVVAQTLPADATLDGLNFSDGRKLTLNGTVPTDKVAQMLNDFEPAIRKFVVRGQPIFDLNQSENLRYQQSGPGTYRWECTLVLKRAEVLQ